MISEYPITYFPNVFDNISFDDIDNDLTWVNYGAPRSEAYYATKNIPYTYGRGIGERTYHPNIVDLDKNANNLLESIWNKLNAHEAKFNNAPYELLFCNRYADQHQHLGWHADDSPAIDISRSIAVVTFGAERQIWFKEISFPGENSYPVEKLVLNHGSLLIMQPGMQQTHLHRIPKHDRPCGPRVSLTFRGLANGFNTFEDKH